MPRMARLVVPGYPHHIIQRGNRRQQTFFCESDYRAYIDFLAEFKNTASVDIWAYCLMPNHVHLVLLPHENDSLARLLRKTHSRYARRINEENGWRGHLWQERFHSFVMDERHLLAAVRYVELNPVRAGLCEHADNWPWSSVHAHLHRGADKLMADTPMCDLVNNWRDYLAEGDSGISNNQLRQHTDTGRPAGSEQFIEKLEALTGRRLRRRKAGRKPIN